MSFVGLSHSYYLVSFNKIDLNKSRKTTGHCIFVFIGVLISIQLLPAKLFAQDSPPTAPIPVEMMFGHNRFFFQSLVTKPFAPGSRLGLFTIATFHAGYKNEQDEFELAIPVQVSYRLWKNFGAFAGVAMNSKSGAHPVIGPQYVLAKRQLVIVVNGRYLLSSNHNLEGFALVEFKPALNDKWSLYSRLQGFYSHNTKKESHDRSFFYLRLGLQKKNFSFGPAANLDQYGPEKKLKENYGVYLSWNFR